MSDVKTDDLVTQEQYIERWENALRLLQSMDAHERERHFDMGTWGRNSPCGTTACLAGHCSLDPWFREQGFTSKWEGRFLLFDGARTKDFFGAGAYLFYHTWSRHASMVRKVMVHVAGLGGTPVVPFGFGMP